MKQLIGKTIAKVTPLQRTNTDDKGFLQLTFTDGTSVLLIGGYTGYTGNSYDEYPTSIYVASKAVTKKTLPHLMEVK